MCDSANRTLDKTKPPLYNKCKGGFAMKSLFKQMDGTNTQQGDYFLPDFQLPPEEERPVGA